MSKCTKCSLDMRVTKTNTELRNHSDAKHNSTIEECFPDAPASAAAMIAAAAPAATVSKPKAKDNSDLSALLSAGLSASTKKK